MDPSVPVPRKNRMEIRLQLHFSARFLYARFASLSLAKDSALQIKTQRKKQREKEVASWRNSGKETREIDSFVSRAASFSIVPPGKL